MTTHRNRFVLHCIIPVCLSGCAYFSGDKDVSPHIRAGYLEQISTLVAGSEYLKTTCNQPDIPSTEQLVSTAVKEGHRMYQNAGEFSEEDVKARARLIQRGLENDNASVAEQCAYFEQSLEVFIQEARKA